MTAGNPPAEFLERGRLGQIFQEDLFGARNALRRQSLGAGAQGLPFSGGEEELGGKFERLEFIPQPLSRWLDASGISQSD